MGCSRPHPYLPCTLNRALKLFPQLSPRRYLHTVLTPTAVQWSHLPPELRALTHPCLWDTNQPQTLQTIADACLAAVFNGLQQPVQCVGYWMARADDTTQKQLREQQRVGHCPDPAYCSNWWQQHKHEVTDMKQLRQQAARLLFTNPPVSPRSGGHAGLVCACMPMVDKSGKRKHIIVKGNYVYLRLQQCGDGLQTIKVSVAKLVAWLFLGAPSEEGLVVCHKDTEAPVVTDPPVAAVKWEHAEVSKPSTTKLFPKHGRCLSYTCASPMCVFFGTQSYNAITGRDRGQLPGGKARRKGG